MYSPHKLRAPFYGASSMCRNFLSFFIKKLGIKLAVVFSNFALINKGFKWILITSWGLSKMNFVPRYTCCPSRNITLVWALPSLLPHNIQVQQIFSTQSYSLRSTNTTLHITSKSSSDLESKLSFNNSSSFYGTSSFAIPLVWFVLGENNCLTTGFFTLPFTWLW